MASHGLASCVGHAGSVSAAPKDVHLANSNPAHHHHHHRHSAHARTRTRNTSFYLPTHPPICSTHMLLSAHGRAQRSRCSEKSTRHASPATPIIVQGREGYCPSTGIRPRSHPHPHPLSRTLASYPCSRRHEQCLPTPGRRLLQPATLAIPPFAIHLPPNSAQECPLSRRACSYNIVLLPSSVALSTGTPAHTVLVAEEHDDSSRLGLLACGWEHSSPLQIRHSLLPAPEGIAVVLPAPRSQCRMRGWSALRCGQGH